MRRTDSRRVREEEKSERCVRGSGLMKVAIMKEGRRASPFVLQERNSVIAGFFSDLGVLTSRSL